MTAPIDFFVAGTPVPQPRPRGRIAGSKFKPFVQIYNPSDADDWKQAVKGRTAVIFRRWAPIENPLQLRLCFIMPRPQSHFLKSGLRLDAPIWHQSRPDLDNLEKAVMDAMTGVAWKDDDQVCQKYGEKRYTAVGELTGVRIVIAQPTTDFIPDPNLLESSCQG